MFFPLQELRRINNENPFPQKRAWRTAEIGMPLAMGTMPNQMITFFELWAVPLAISCFYGIVCC